jgi:hypothetical protein
MTLKQLNILTTLSHHPGVNKQSMGKLIFPDEDPTQVWRSRHVWGQQIGMLVKRGWLENRGNKYYVTEKGLKDIQQEAIAAKQTLLEALEYYEKVLSLALSTRSL